VPTDVAQVAATVQEWLAGGAQVGVAWPVAFVGFSSRRPGEVLALTETGQQVGEVLGGRITASLAQVLASRLGDAAAVAGPVLGLLHVPVDEPAAAAAGLACGGTVTVALHRAAGMPAGFWQAVAGGQPVALVTHVDDGAHGAGVGAATGSLLVSPSGIVAGTLGTAELDEQGTATALSVLAEGRTASRVVELTPGLGALVIEAVVPPATLVVVGRGEVADALERQAAVIGWQLSVVDGPDVATVAAAIAGLGPGDGMLVISHNHDIGVPALAAALASTVGYIGALGSRRTQAARRDLLLAGGAHEPELARIHGPAGLDLGGRAPEEIALAICAERLAVRSGRDAGALSHRPGSIHS
jgi:xanthine dehydrogenase accessory factor